MNNKKLFANLLKNVKMGLWVKQLNMKQVWRSYCNITYFNIQSEITIL
ncbi:hypothetical protein RG47T_4406 [Mucilaginibacter polytrichastri]|uniref:Uncharacterized protein n=1 Tax=Mucilaginibacter polytrichastri TaxID=1302689 RepID=A0A1Q6A4J7_9SPHI|nr:hypothetical protein RG47T_4406 [Mucilaginibacter polytrichastri]SFT25615.1 hypothetical protein SAMN04487890_12330 [Mucilaginibacter polytrichastri]